jgi:hypothetical protein
MRAIEFVSLRKLAIHTFAISILYIALALIRYPYLLNGDHFFTADEAMLASTIYGLINGEPIVFYYDFGRTFGLTFGLISAPLMWVLGPTALAFHLPGMLYHALYIWTTFLIAKIVIPRTAYLILVLMFFSPSFITQMTIHNWPHILVAFMGNLIFLLFLKLKKSKEKNILTTFFLFFTIGLAIYTYTYSLIFILVLAVLCVLTHPHWSEIREKLSLVNLLGVYKKEQTTKDFVCKVLDVLIILFFFFVSFAYVFGGFGLDFGGVSILQINKFHAAAIQLLGLILLRFFINPKKTIALLKNIQSYFTKTIHEDKKRMTIAGGMGFLIGLSPRIASILIGETSRGGQGHDTDFLPTKLFAHLYSLLFRNGPRLFDFDKTYENLILNPVNTYQAVFGLLFVVLIVILLISIFSLISVNRAFLKNVIVLKGFKFEPVQIVILTPIVVCMANTIVQNGPETRYLFPLFGASALWVGIYLDKMKIKFRSFPIIFLAIWISFYSISNYRAYQNAGLLKNGKLVKFDENFIFDLIKFLEKKNISVAYSPYSLSGLVTYLSGGEIIISEYYSNPVAKTRKERSLASPDFAIIAQKKEDTIYREFLLQNKIESKVDEFGGYKIYWDFLGDQVQINKLRSLIRQN